MIFITVGTTMPFDELLEEADRLAGEGFFDQNLVCQFGQSSYRMANGQQFMAKPAIEDLIEASSLVITHGGSTVIKLLLAQKPFVAFPNPRGAGDHQTSFLTTISEVVDVSWSREVTDMRSLIIRRQAAGASRLNRDFPRASAILRSLI